MNQDNVHIRQDCFLRAVDNVLQHEGGYVNDPYDSGGETRFGISKRSYPYLDIKNLTREQAVQLYRTDWWDRYGYEMIADEGLAVKLFDLSVNMGANQAHRILQRAVNDTGCDQIEVDGILGPKSIEAINNHPNPPLLLATFTLGAIRFYIGIKGAEHYLVGWVRRALSDSAVTPK